ncbi:FAD-binding protein [Arthrobacter sp. YD2]|uniref:FAD-binding protein n=1 Tax=Arthrobacter sp. YD2 TaxID=3058046 RepID=UPI0025B3745C|nr:FAD-binding protein [Arthrobacter sp. YD2]MDN3902942.1 FAD-binding protein [Arthrobacter sp. YD2]
MNPDRNGAGRQTPIPERTRTVVIGCGLSGMAVAAELSRQGVDSIVVHGPVPDAEAIRGAAAEPEPYTKRDQLRRILQGYAASHQLDIRGDSPARDLRRAAPSGLRPSPVAGTGRWAVRTGRGVLLADTIVLTSCSRSDLRKMTKAAGVATWPETVTALREAGVYFVGVGGTMLPTVSELLRQAKAAGEAIAGVILPTDGPKVSPRATAAGQSVRSKRRRR